MSGGLWQFQLGVGLLALSAPGLSALVFGRLIARRFDVHRGFALGVATSGISITTLFLPPVVAAVIDASDWRFGYLLLGGLAVVVGLPVALLAIRATRVEPLLPSHAPLARNVRQTSQTPSFEPPGISAADARRSGNFCGSRWRSCSSTWRRSGW
jgi:MFS family permease